MGDSLTGEVSEEDEAAEMDEDNQRRESFRYRGKVGMPVETFGLVANML